MIYVWLTVYILLMLAFFFFNFFGLPGNWLIVATSLVWVLVGPAAFRYGWLVPGLLVIMGLIGELIEFGASVAGARRLGGSRGAAACSVAGSIAGALAGAILGIPVPVPLVGMLLGSVIFAAIGAWLGATLAEQWQGRPFKESFQIGNAAFLGRIMGTIGKIVVGFTMVVFAIASLFLLN